MYPRPDFERPDLRWELLDGDWDFAFDDDNVGLHEQWYCKELPSKRTIKVPFAFQTPASGINNQDAHEFVWYQRAVNRLCEDPSRLVVRFGAVDYEATVWLNDYYIGFHTGGHVPFQLDLSDSFRLIDQPQARLTVRVRDSPHDLTQPRGKQYWKPKSEAIWYTPATGIWQSVWLECLPATRVGGHDEGTVLRSTDISTGSLVSKVVVIGAKPNHKLRVEVEASLDGVAVAKASEAVSDIHFAAVELSLRLTPQGLDDLSKCFTKQHAFTDKECWRDGLALWSPAHPILYDVTIRLFEDSHTEPLDIVKTYTGARLVEWGGGSFKLNGTPYFQALVLDQGYWPDTGITPPSYDALKADIELAKNMGFNGCRKHQKVEDPVFLYWADTLGYLVWGEMANAYQFNDTYIQKFNEEWTASVYRDRSHPCLVAWTPINESWGYDNLMGSASQRNHIRALYFATKALDDSRPINDNCGWEHVQTDLITFHNYSDVSELTSICSDVDRILDKHSNRALFARPVEVSLGEDGNTPYSSLPIICTEFGGLNIKPEEGTQTKKGDWGYITAENPDDLLARLEGLCIGIVRGGNICGFVYTQLTDIEQEVNGLYTFDRKEKLSAQRVKEVMEKAMSWFYSHQNVCVERV